MKYSVMKETDIKRIIPLYIDYYNNQENGAWTTETTYKRIHQVLTREDSYCLILENNETILGFAIGYCEQFDDIQAYNLVEIVIAHQYQNQGYGKQFMLELEKRLKDIGVPMIQLQAVNDEMHKHFYGKLNYKDTGSFITKTKWI